MSISVIDQKIIDDMRQRYMDISFISNKSVESRMQELEHQLGIQHRKIIALEADNEIMKEIIEELENG